MKKVRARIDTHIILWRSDLPLDAQEALKEAFTRNNPDYSKKIRYKLWLGDTPEKIESWSADNRFFTFPRGVIGKLEDILMRHSLYMNPIKDCRVDQPPAGFRFEPGHALWSHQVRPARALILAGSGIIRGECASGKTVILMEAIRVFNQPALIVVHTKPLQELWEGMISEWFGIVPGRIGGKGKPRIRPITVAIQKSLWGMAKRGDTEWAKQFGVLVADEIHHWAARTFRVVADMFPAKYRIGASADERRKDNKQFLIYETFGPVVAKISNKDLVASGKKVPKRIIIVPTDYKDPEYFKQIEKNIIPDWTLMIKNIVFNKERNNIIFKILNKVVQKYKLKALTTGKINKHALDPGEQRNLPEMNIRCISQKSKARIILFTERQAAAREWVVRLRRSGIATGLMIGGDDNEAEFSASVQGLKDGTLQVGVGTPKADEGLDIKPLTHVFITCPLHTHLSRLGQMIGRVARADRESGKQEAICYYFWDRFMFPMPDPEESSLHRELREKKFLQKLARVADSMEILESS